MISFFQNISSPPVDYSIGDFCRGILTGKWREKVEIIRNTSGEVRQQAKRGLPAVTISGAFEGSRKMRQIKNISGYICLDLDRKENPDMNINAVKHKVSADCYFAAISASGEGLFIIYPLAQRDSKSFKRAFRYFQLFFELEYGLIIDKGCSDITRLRFVSYDPQAIYNPEAAEFEITEMAVIALQAQKNKGDYAVGNRHNYITEIALISNRQGIEREEAEQWVNSNYPEFAEETKTIFESVYAREEFHGIAAKNHSIERTDVGNTEAFVSLFKDRLFYIRETDTWYLWDENYWRPVNDYIVQIVIKFTESIEDAEYRLKCRSVSKINNIITLAKSYIVKHKDVHSQNAELIAAKNAYINLRTGESMPPQRDYFITRLINADYNEDANCPLWENHIATIMGNNPELIDYMQRMMGYLITGLTNENKVFFWYGHGANGKTLTINVLKHIMGEYLNVIPQSLIIEGGRNEHPVIYTKLYGSRIAVLNETDANARLNEAGLKMISGSDLILARPLYGDFFEFKPTHKLVYITNHKPIITDVGLGLWRRLHLVPFNISIPEEKQDKNLFDKLIKESSGILNWLVEGAVKYFQDGLNPPYIVISSTEEYRAESDLIGQYILENTQPAVNGDSAPSSEIYEDYRRWAILNGLKPVSHMNFSRRLKEHGYIIEHRRSGNYINLMLKSKMPF